MPRPNMSQTEYESWLQIKSERRVFRARQKKKTDDDLGSILALAMIRERIDQITKKEGKTE